MRPLLLPLVIALALTLPALTLPAAAQDAVRFDIAPTTECIAQARRSAERMLCVGEAARACHQRVQGATTLDVSLCMAEETKYWTARMTDALGAMHDKAEESDRAFAETDLAEKVPFKLTEDLAAMQTAWEAWRETRCAFEAMLRRGTPYAATAAANCMLQQTGAQALFLESAVRH